MNVLLFDIDGTLVRTGGAGGNALRAAFCEEFDVPQAADVPFSGRTDRGIAQNLFHHHGIDNAEPNWHKLRDGYLQRLPMELQRCQGRVLSGVCELLETLSRRADVALGLLTGNTARGARLKLQHYGIYDYFSFGGYGDRHPHRNDVARAAVQAAAQFLNSSVDVDRTWVIGDTPMDVECARAVGARAVAVSTGFHPHHELKAAEPDVLLTDLETFLEKVQLAETTG